MEGLKYNNPPLQWSGDVSMKIVRHNHEIGKSDEIKQQSNGNTSDMALIEMIPPEFWGVMLRELNEAGVKPTPNDREARRLRIIAEYEAAIKRRWRKYNTERIKAYYHAHKKSRDGKADEV